MTNIIKFHSYQMYNSEKNSPEPTIKNMPDWYMNTEKYSKDKNGEYKIGWNGEREFSFKACPSLLDSMSSGYVLKTPCNILFYEHNGEINVMTPPGYESFCSPRPAMENYVVPYGYRERHFHWYPNWFPQLPEGYSAIFINPINQNNLPFQTVSGIIDNDKYDIPGFMPFFLRENWTGWIEEGTPFVQIIPFKREDWNQELVMHNEKEIHDKINSTALEMRVPGGEIYKKRIWSRRKYK